MSEEALQITLRADLSEQRPSTKPLVKHRKAAEELLELRNIIADLQDQASAINAIIAEKGRLVGALEKDLIQYAREYKNRAFRTEKVLIYLQDVEERKSKSPRYKAAWEWAVGKLTALGQDMNKEAAEFLESTKATIPGKEELGVEPLEAKDRYLGEVWAGMTKLLKKFMSWGDKNEQKLDVLEDFVSERL